MIIAAGKSVRQGSVAELKSEAVAHVRVRTPQPDALIAALDGARVRRTDQPDLLLVDDRSAPETGKAAFAAGVELHELTPVQSDLEQLFLELTSGQEEIR